MAELLRCERGHRWPALADGTSPSCPECGSPSVTEPSEGNEPAPPGSLTAGLAVASSREDLARHSATIAVELPTSHSDFALDPEQMPALAVAEAQSPQVLSPTDPLTYKLPFGTVAPTEVPATRIIAGRYEIQGELGRGGMGVVYKARHLQLQRVVALKMILAGVHASLKELSRFRAEAEAIARLQHPNIVQIFEIGEEDGLPFFSLEFVEGGSLAAKARAGPLPPTEAARTVEALGRAMDYAHQQGILHRDLKPANVLLTGAGDPKITDFGLAKFLDAEKGQTRTGAVAGTPSYMAPEQASGKMKLTGPAADIYSLGAILYALLTGRAPFHADTTMSTLQQVIKDEPVPPTRLQSKVPRDLETICLKCLQKDPQRRYATALELAEDLHRFQTNEPIRARPVGRLEKSWKWARRRPALAALLAVSACAILLLLGAGWWHSATLATYNERLEEEVIKTDEQRQIAVKLQGVAENQRGRAEEREQGARRYWYVSDLNLAQQAWEQANSGRLLQLLNRQKPAEGQADLRGFEWYHLWRLCHSERLVVVDPDIVWAVAFAPDGGILATANARGAVRLWDVARGQALGTLEAGSDQLTGLAFSPDGKTLATSCVNGVLDLWEVATRTQQKRLTRTGALLTVAYSPDGKMLATGGNDGMVALWDATTGKDLAILKGHTGHVTALAFSSDSATLVSGSWDKNLIVWDVATRKQRLTLRGHADFVLAVAIDPQGQLIASGCQDGAIKLWDAATGQLRKTFAAHTEAVTGLAFAPDSSHLASGSRDSTARLWNPAADLPLATWKGHTGMILSLAFSPKNHLLATGSVDHTVRVWDVTHPPELPLIKDHLEAVWSVAFHPRGEMLATASPDGKVLLRRFAGDKPLLPLIGHKGPVCRVLFSPDGKTLATGGTDHTIKLWDPGTGQLQATLQGHRGLVNALSFSQDGSQLLSGGPDGTLRLWSVAEKKESGIFHVRDAGIVGAALSPDGQTIACGLGDGAVQLLEVATQKLQARLVGHTAGVSALAFFADGRLLASGSDDQTLRLWDVAKASEVAVLQGHADAVRGLEFMPDGKSLASSSFDGSVKLWDLATLQERQTLRGPGQPVWSIAAAPTGRFLAAGLGDGSLKLWEAAPQDKKNSN
jgi:WD40 repeat protein